ncbi:glycosyltransferase [Accumulibacter sp.]|uniref:glycosyltransferase n=1 Tax=Accumulibacter sp. TaxID=2053492 RepID=UPI002636745E|nr:glycosyltransferase [Accumulibacter sp.]
MGSQKNVLVFASSYLPGFKGGGPVRSISNLVEALGDDLEFRILTADRDLGETTAYPDRQAGVWHTVGKAKVQYLSPEQLRLQNMFRLLRETDCDTVYLNSFFDPRFSVVPLALYRYVLRKRPQVVLAPRGEFSSGALGLKARKKRAFLGASRLLGLHQGITWQASSQHELDDIRAVMGHAATDIRLSPPFPGILGDLPPPRESRFPEEPLRLVYLARIVPMKNLLFALEVLAQVQVRVVFSIYGPCEDQAYWKACQEAIARLPKNVSVRENGPLPQSEIPHVLADQDLLFLPTKGENFGHTIAEALGAGVRVLISDRTMWRNLESEGVGYDLALESPGSFVRAIETEYYRAHQETLRLSCRAYLARKLELDKLRVANRGLFGL